MIDEEVSHGYKENTLTSPLLSFCTTKKIRRRYRDLKCERIWKMMKCKSSKCSQHLYHNMYAIYSYTYLLISIYKLERGSSKGFPKKIFNNHNSSRGKNLTHGKNLTQSNKTTNFEKKPVLFFSKFVVLLDRVRFFPWVRFFPRLDLWFSSILISNHSVF